MIWHKGRPPQEALFLAKLNDYERYYVLARSEYDLSGVYREASGEQYSSWDEDEIIAWVTLDELDECYFESQKDDPN